jgi:hypothetical protein
MNKSIIIFSIISLLAFESGIAQTPTIKSANKLYIFKNLYVQAIPKYESAIKER